ncbi:MAG: hypothetical protein JAY96_12745 [Candidatus Thiodiazotropha endolucinida]|nr:hypothetical protein [Candidatus Thiodiazotropha taylori]MCW4249056.1 hypothetical protein [Candidatus Thiodiazotropha endolucinida]
MELRQRGRPKKRTTEDEASASTSKRQQICILHYEESKAEAFTFMSELCNPAERLNDLHDIREKRLSQPAGSKDRMESTCGLIPSAVSEGHGYHRDCYKRFTRHLDRLAKEEPSQSSTTRVAQRRSSADKIALFAKDCIFCNKEGKISLKKSGVRTTEDTSKFASDSWKTVLESAENRNDEKLLLRIRGFDLFASEAHFHNSCRKKYIQDPQYWRSSDSEAILNQEALEEAHEKAFRKVCDRVTQEVVEDRKVIKLSDLVNTYISVLEGTKFANPEYRGSKLKAKLESVYGKEIAFTQLQSEGKFMSQLVFSSHIKLEEAIQSAFILGSKDSLTEAADYLRKSIQNAYNHSEELKWPPTADQLGNIDISPEELSTFLTYVLSGKTKDASIQVNRLVSSIGQDICRAVTNGEWKTPKHILVCMTLRHLFRSQQLTTLLNRLGHCESYSFSVELETAIAQALEQTSSLLSTQIIREPEVPSLFHSEFDNFDQLINTLTGAGSIHTAHGIMMQEILTGDMEEHGGTVPDIPSLPRTKEKSLKLRVEEELPDCFVGQRKSPSYTSTKKLYPGSEGTVKTASESNMIWMILRASKSVTGQEVPGWTGFVSITGSKPTILTTIDYYPVINRPITEYKTVQECLRYAEEASKEVGQTYVITTFDLGVCMKAFPLIWNNPQKYANHIVMIGTFHLVCAYLKMLGKKMAGSGLSDVMLEAGLIGTGSIQGVLTGKHYERAMHCHKIVLESLERLLLEQFLVQRDSNQLLDTLPEAAQLKVQNLIHLPSKDTLEETVKDDAVHSYITEYCQYREKVHSGELGKTAQFWIAYMEHVWLVLCLIKAVKTNNFLLYAECLNMMADLFFSFDGQNYARYLTFFSVFIANIDETHPGATDLLQRGAMSVARSFIPGNRCAVDKTMEETFMKHAKSRSGAGGSGAGVTGITSNYDAYQRWVRTTHERSKYVEATLDMADMLVGETESSTWHRELRPAEVQKGDKEVCETKDAISGFINPFAIDDKSHLYCISSGVQVSEKFENDILLAEHRGKVAKESFIKERIEKKEKFFDPIKRQI